MGHRWLVIGSNSFSGATFVQELLERDEQVVSVSRSAENALPLLPYGWVEAPKRLRNQFHQLDLNQHTTEILALTEKIKPHYVVNFAAQSMVAESWIYPDQWYQTNVVAMSVCTRDYAVLISLKSMCMSQLLRSTGAAQAPLPKHTHSIRALPTQLPVRHVTCT